jgi:hypothetical protein
MALLARRGTPRRHLVKTRWAGKFARDGFLEKRPLRRSHAAPIMRLDRKEPDRPAAGTSRYQGGVDVLTVRPKVAELTFQLYGRPLHPELFQVFETCTVQRGGYTAKIDITSAGHVVTWRYAGLTLTEVAASAHHPLPKMRRLLSYGLKGQRTDRIECRGGVRYQMGFQLEPTTPEVFWTFQQELADQGRRQGLLHRFDSGGRLAMGALSYVNLEVRNRSLLVQVFHTFPDDYAVVKSQSLFQLP